MPENISKIDSYRRDEELRRRINSFLIKSFHLRSDDYFAKMDLGSLLELKSVLSDINNTLTMRLTLGFAEWLAQVLKMDQVVLDQLRSDVLSTKPNANGYDIAFPNTRYPSIVAEVKCNLPINGGTKYGAAQRNGIIADIDALLHGKRKASSLPTQTESLKFMVFLDMPKVRAANAHLMASNAKIAKEFRVLEPGQLPSDPRIVYGVYAHLGA